MFDEKKEERYGWYHFSPTGQQFKHGIFNTRIINNMWSVAGEGARTFNNS